MEGHMIYALLYAIGAYASIGAVLFLIRGVRMSNEDAALSILFGLIWPISWIGVAVAKVRAK